MLFTDGYCSNCGQFTISMWTCLETGFRRCAGCGRIRKMRRPEMPDLYHSSKPTLLAGKEVKK